MSGISGYYYIGTAGGFLGADGLLGKDVEITIWEGDVRSLSVRYLTNRYEPMSKELKSFIPKGPDDENQAREAIILFASNLFKDCPSYDKVKLECEGIDRIDFCDKTSVPKHFYDLLEESKSIKLEDVNMFKAVIYNVSL